MNARMDGHINGHLNSQKGFSLIELMVVVAIIGILASLAVPNVLKFMAKARQSEVKTLLSGIYTSEKAFYAEYNGYHTAFQAIGYSPEGQLRYNAGFSGVGTGGEAGAGNGFNTPVTNTAMSTLAYCGTGTTMTNGCAMVNGTNGGLPSAISSSTASVTTFTASGNAWIYNPLLGTAAQEDRWTMTDSKLLVNTSNGIP